MPALKEIIKQKIVRSRKARTFIPQDFLDLGSRGAVDQALSRLVKEGIVRRVARGMYELPKYSELLKTTLSPSPEEVLKLIAGREHITLQETGASAANALGFSTQVPAKKIYLTNGTPRKIEVGNVTVELRHAKPRSLIEAGTKVGLLLQALKYVGQKNIDNDIIARARKLLTKREKEKLLTLRSYVPAWMWTQLERIAEVQKKD